MKIKEGTICKDVTSYGNKYWIQIEDSLETENSDLKELVGSACTIIIGDIKAIHDFNDERGIQ